MTGLTPNPLMQDAERILIARGIVNSSYCEGIDVALELPDESNPAPRIVLTIDTGTVILGLDVKNALDLVNAIHLASHLAESRGF